MHNLWSIYSPSYFWRSKQPNWFFGPIRPNKANWKLLDLIVLLCAQFTFVVFPDDNALAFALSSPPIVALIISVLSFCIVIAILAVSAMYSRLSGSALPLVNLCVVSVLVYRRPSLIELPASFFHRSFLDFVSCPFHPNPVCVPYFLRVPHRVEIIPLERSVLLVMKYHAISSTVPARAKDFLRCFACAC
jgi:hypothetical protein